MVVLVSAERIGATVGVLSHDLQGLRADVPLSLFVFFFSFLASCFPLCCVVLPCLFSCWKETILYVSFLCGLFLCGSYDMPRRPTPRLFIFMFIYFTIPHVPPFVVLCVRVILPMTPRLLGRSPLCSGNVRSALCSIVPILLCTYSDGFHFILFLPLFFSSLVSLSSHIPTQ